MTVSMLSVAVLLTLQLAACSTKTPDGEPSAVASDRAASASSAQPSGIAATASAQDSEAVDQMSTPPGIRYSCENGTAVVAQYVESHTGQQSVNLEVAGREYGLAESMSGSGAKYETEEGMTPGKRLVWWTKGDGAMLIEGNLKDTDGSSETIVNCQQTSPSE